MRQLLLNTSKKLYALWLFCLIALLFNSTSAQTPAIQWQKTLGGTEGDEGSHSIIRTADNGILTGGVVSSKDGDGQGNHGSRDLLVVKMNAAGTVAWKKVLGGGREERGTFVLQSRSGGFIVGGTTSSNNGDVSGNKGGFDIWIVKLDASGGISWQRTIGGSGDEELVSIRENASNEILIGGNSYAMSKSWAPSTASDYLVAKLASNGTLQWQTNLGGSGTDILNQLQATADGGCIGVGMTSSSNGQVSGFHGMRDTWVVKLRNNGTLEWQRALGGSGDEFYCAVQTTIVNSVEGYVLAVRTNSNDGDVSGNHGGFDIWVIKLDASGKTLWKKTYGGSGWEELGGIKNTKDGGFVIGANTGSTDGTVTGLNGATDAWVVKIDGNGNLQWQTTLGGSDDEEIMQLQQTTDDGYIVSVCAQSGDGQVSNFHGKLDMWLVKLDVQGRLQWQRAFGGSNEEWNIARGYPFNVFFTSMMTAHDEYQLQAADGNYMFITSTISNDGDVQGLHYSARLGLRYDNWVVKVTPPATRSNVTVAVFNNGMEKEEQQHFIKAYPNPFNRHTTIRFSVPQTGALSIDLFHSSGVKVRTLFDAKVNGGQLYTINLQDAILPKGVYFYQLRNGKNQLSGRLVKN